MLALLGLPPGLGAGAKAAPSPELLNMLGAIGGRAAEKELIALSERGPEGARQEAMRTSSVGGANGKGRARAVSTPPLRAAC